MSTTEKKDPPCGGWCCHKLGCYQLYQGEWTLICNNFH